MRSPECRELTFDGYSLLVLSFFAERAEMKIGNEQSAARGRCKIIDFEFVL